MDDGIEFIPFGDDEHFEYTVGPYRNCLLLYGVLLRLFCNCELTNSLQNQKADMFEHSGALKSKMVHQTSRGIVCLRFDISSDSSN